MPVPSIQEIRALADARRYPEAVEACDRYLAENPDDADAWHLSAKLYLWMARYEDAAFQLMSARSVRPHDPAFDETQREIDCGVLTEQGLMLQRLGRYAEAAAAYRKTAEHYPDRPWPINNMGDIHMGAGRVDSAVETFRRAAFMDRPLPAAHSNLLMAMMHSDRFTPEQLLREHRAWAERFTPEHTFPPPVIHDPDPSRPIRVGYVSPDFRNHPVSLFMLPVLANHDRSAVEVTCYDDADLNDAMTDRLRGTGCRWVVSSALSYEQLFSRVRDDRIDILIDLAVHTGANRIPVFAARAAPVQMTWLGYAGSTGCPAVDYRITDPIVDPPGMTEHHFTERLLRLPETLWCFGPPEQDDVSPHVAPRHPGRVTFGTATRLAKVSPTCLDAWAELLRRVEGSRLVLAAEALGDATIVDEWRHRFADREIAPDRVELLASRGYRSYLQLLGSFDVGLDTFPFNGGTTACQMLWMGTPVVGLAGRTSVSRVTASVLTNVGLSDLVADTPEAWIGLNVRLAADAARRAELRQSLRPRMKASPLCDAARFTRNLEAAFRRAFVERCAGENQS